MDPASLFDPLAASVVLGGAIMAAALRAGPGASLGAFRACLGLARRFDAGSVRAGMACQLGELRRDGFYRARARSIGDAAMEEAVAALLSARSIAVFRNCCARQRLLRGARAQRDEGVLLCAAEAAPAFGLVGTLVALSQMVPSGAGFAPVVASAVLTTLYGVLCSQLLFAPLAAAVARAAQAEEAARSELLDWAEEQIAPLCPGAGSGLRLTERRAA